MFTGFTPEALDMLFQIRIHDSKSYYESVKADYRRVLLTPFCELIEDISPAMREIDPAFYLDPGLNKTISKMRRDTRFAKDKSQYRDAKWFFIRPHGHGWLSGPGYFFELSPISYSLGIGLFSPSPACMEIFRRRVDENPTALKKIVASLPKGDFKLGGDRYKRDRAAHLPEEIRVWYNSKSLYYTMESGDLSKVMRAEFADELIGIFKDLAPLYRYFSEVWRDYEMTGPTDDRIRPPSGRRNA